MNNIERKNYNGIKAGIWYTIGNIIIKGIPFLSIPIFTNLLSTSDFGIYTIYISYQEIMSLIMGLGISGIIKIAKFEYRDKFENFISFSYGIVLLIGIFFLGSINLLFNMINIGNWFTKVVANLLIINSVFVVLYSIMNSKYIIEGKYFRNLFTVFGLTFLNIFFSIVMCLTIFQKTPYLGRIIGTTLGSFCIGILILVEQNRIKWINLKEKYYKFIIQTGIPLIPHQLTISLFTHSDKLMIQHFMGDEKAGIYGVAVLLSMLLAVILNSIDNAWTPWVYSLLKEKKYSILVKNNNLIVIFFMYLTTCFILISPDVFHIMTSRDYWEGILVLIPIIVSIYLNFMYIFSVVIEYSLKKTSFISLTSIVCLVINIILNYVMIQKYGYLGAAYATCISRGIMFIFHFLISKCLFKQKIVSTMYLIFSFMVVCMISLFTYYYQNMVILRWSNVLLFTVIVLLYFYKHGVLKKLKIQ